MNDLAPHAVKIFDDTLESITGANAIEKAHDTRLLAQGYITGLRLLGVITDRQFNAMSTLLDVAVDAVNQRIEKTASLLEQESGLKGDHPSKDDSLTDYSITIISANVKGGGLRAE
jgi:hypothetical protein